MHDAALGTAVVFYNIVRHGVIAVAGTNSFDFAVVRLVACDYAGNLMAELGPGGFRDYDLSTNGESVEDLQFADDGSLWLAISDRSEFNKIGKVLRLGASTTAPLHNWFNALDVSGDNQIRPLDALLVINRLQSPTASPGSKPDTNGDAVISPIDALLVINWLNKSRLGSGEGEQEATNAAVDSALASIEIFFSDFDIITSKRRAGRASAILANVGT
jgi:Dockerin type I domain